MSVTILYALTGVGLFALGLYALAAHAHLLRKIIAFNVMGSGVFLALGALAHRTPDQAPDPVSHAMIITGIVVAVSATAFALVLMLRVQSETGQSLLPEPPSD